MNLRDFIRLNLTEPQRLMWAVRCPSLAAELELRRFTDSDFVVRVIRNDEDALWTLWFCLHSSFFVRIIRMRSKHACGSPCTLFPFEEMPCKWSSRVLDDYYEHMTTPGAGLLESFLGNDELGLSFMEYLGIQLHEKFHADMLGRHGFKSLDEEALPVELRKLFKRDDRFRTIFVNRWLWGLTEIPVLEEAILPALPPETLLRWVDEVDNAVLVSPELATLMAQVQAASRLRLKSGIPPRGGHSS